MSARSIVALLLSALVAGGVGAAPRDAAPVAARPPPPKPTGPIAVDYRLTGAAVVGVPLEVAITARSVGATGFVLEASAADAALVIAAQTSVAEADGERSWIVAVVPVSSGATYLNVVVSAEIEGLRQARSLVIPIRTQSAKDQAVTAPDAASAASTEGLILLPVQESP